MSSLVQERLRPLIIRALQDKPQNQQMSSLCPKNAQDTTTGTTPQDTVTHSTRDVLKKKKETNLETVSCVICLEEKTQLGKGLTWKYKTVYPDPSSRGVTLWVEQKGCVCVCKPGPSATRCGPGSLTGEGSCLRCTWNASMLLFSHFQHPTSLQRIEIPDLLTNSPLPKCRAP